MSRKQNFRSARSIVIPNETINALGLFGRGLGYDGWKAILEKEGFRWTGGLKNTLIRKEFMYFKSEILRLKVETHGYLVKRRRDQPDPNSAKSILMRMQGEPWMDGAPSEREQRLRDSLLFGKDARVRTLLNYLEEWKNDVQALLEISSNKQASPPAAASKIAEIVGNDQSVDGILDDILSAYGDLSLTSDSSGDYVAPLNETYSLGQHESIYGIAPVWTYASIASTETIDQNVCHSLSWYNGNHEDDFLCLDWDEMNAW